MVSADSAPRLSPTTTPPSPSAAWDLSQQCFASGRVEVVQEVRQQHQIVPAAILDIKRAAFNRSVTIADRGIACVLFRDFQHGCPIQRDDLSLRIVFRNGDSVQTMSGGDIKNLQSVTNRPDRPPFGNGLAPHVG
jgi:hypothetical protein